MKFTCRGEKNQKCQLRNSEMSSLKYEMSTSNWELKKEILKNNLMKSNLVDFPYLAI